MATLPNEIGAGASDAPPALSILHLEMQAGERRVLTLFASSFLKWIKDEAASSFARDVGTPASISLDENAPDTQGATLHLTVTWTGSATEAPAARLAVREPSSGYPEARVPGATPASFLFAYDSEAPVFALSPGTADVTMMMAAVLDRSERLRRTSTLASRVLPWIPAPLVTEAARGGQLLARCADATIQSTGVFRARSRQRARQVAALWHSVRLVSPADGRSAVQLLWSSARIKPVSWAAAGLLAALVIYVAWPSATPAKGPVMRGIAAETPSASKPATVVAPRRETPAPVVAAEAHPTQAEPLPTSGVVVQAASAAASANLSRATANAPRVKPALQARGYVGSLVVNSEPQGAEVSVDGVAQGRTPVAIANLNIGSRVVRLDLPGHQRWSWAVSIVAGRQTPIAVRLLPVASRTATPGVGF